MVVTSYSVPEIKDLRVFQLTVHEDSRGWFKENFNQKDFIAAGLPETFFNGILQNNVSKSYHGVVRGMHGQPWEKIVSVAHGKVLGMWVDLRPGEGFGRSFSLEMDETLSVYVPKGVANGIQVLSDIAIFNYLVNGYYDDTMTYPAVDALDPELGLPWRDLGGADLRSAKDKTYPPFKELSK